MRAEKMTFIPPEELFGAVLQMLREGYDAEFTVVGNSMWPFLANKRDKVTIRKAEYGLLKKGDIVLLKTDHGYLLHRITRLKKGMIQTTGDSNCYRDDPVPVESVLGRVVSFTRKGRQICCDNFSYRCIGWIWRVTFPIRPLLLRILFRIGRRAS